MLCQLGNLFPDFRLLFLRRISSFVLEFFNLFVDRVGLRLPVRPLVAVDERRVVLVRRSEERLQSVIVFLFERVEHVIVAAGTADRQPEKHRPDGVGHFGEDFVPAERDLGVAGISADGAKPMKTCRDDLIAK